MKLIVAGIYPPDIGGPATYAVLLERELPKHGVAVTVIPFGSVRHLPPVIRHFAYAGKLFSALRGADALLVQDTVSSGFPGVLVAQLLRKPLIIRVPGDYAWEQGTQRFGVTDSIDEFQAKRYGFRVELMRSLQEFVVRSAAMTVVPSRYMERIVRAWMPKGHPLRVIYNGIELPIGTVRPERTFAHPLIVSVGRLVPWKGFAGVIEALSLEPAWHLAIIGEGPDREALESLAREKSCADRVTFIPALPRAEMLGICEEADAFVLNSTYEGLSHLLLEVLSRGVPAIATKVGGNPEVIEDGISGTLISPESPEALRAAITEILTDPARAARYREAARKRSEDFSIDATIESFVRMLQDVCPSAFAS